MNWRFWQRKRDVVDGYEPTAPPAGDPWRQPAVVEQLERRAHDGEQAGFRRDADALDGFRNTLTGIGDWTRDKTFGGRPGGPAFDVYILSGRECQDRWRGYDLGRRIIQTIPNEMTRAGFDVTVQPVEGEARGDQFGAAGFGAPAQPVPGELPDVSEEGTEASEQVAGEVERLRVQERLYQALCYERAYGGGAVLIGADDGQEDLSKPLDEDRIESVDHLTAFRGGWDGECVAWSYYDDPREAKYGEPDVYMLRNLGTAVRMVAPGSTEVRTYRTAPAVFWVHESRLLTFSGVLVSRDVLTQMRGWSDSLFTSVDRVLQQYDQTWGGVANLMTDFSQGVLAMEGLAAALAKVGGQKVVQERALAMQLSRSLARIMLVDSKEKFSRDTASLAGVSDILQQFGLRLAAAADMPVDLLMGQTQAGGLNKGDTTLRFFYDRVAADQQTRLMPQLRRLLDLLFKAKRGPTGGRVPERWNVAFRPLYQMSAGERAELRLKTNQADDLEIKNGVLSPEEVASSEWGGSEWSPDRVIDFEGRARMAEEQRTAQAEREAALKVAAEEAAVKPSEPGGGAEEKQGVEPEPAEVEPEGEE